jgi:hypothetical protein
VQDTAPRDVVSLPDESADAQDVPDGSQPSQDVAALPDGQTAPYDGLPPMPGEQGAASGQAGPPGQYGTDGPEQWGDERGAPWDDGQQPQVDAYGRPLPRDPYGSPDQGDPYGTSGQGDPYGAAGQGDPYGSPQGEQWNGQDSTAWGDQNSEEWVEVMISGAPMRATASEDAPMLFAFPYGRNLKVVSRYEGWVEVADPKSGATGWMQAHVLAPARANRDPYGQSEAYYDEGRERGPGEWLRRGADEFSDMLNRAFGGH